MNILHRLDAWLGKTLFHPPIILLCQVTHQSQYAIHRALWFLAVCHATYYAMAKGAGWGMTIFLWLWLLFTMANAAIHPDRHARSAGVVRLFFWAILAADSLAWAISGQQGNDVVRAVILLFAEYAATIKTIPPRKTRERSAKGKAVKA